jgi:RES domain-containing protein
MPTTGRRSAIGPTRSSSGLLAIELPIDSELIRIHHNDRRPVYFGPPAGSPPQNRFDAPGGEYRILYAAERLEGAFVETILRRPEGRILRRAYVNERAWTTLRVQRALLLAKIYDEGLQGHGIDAGLISTDDYAGSRNFALRVFNISPPIDGLAYRSRYDNGEICYALFDRVNASDLAAVHTERFDGKQDRVDELMTLYRAVFDTSAPV